MHLTAFLLFALTPAAGPLGSKVDRFELRDYRGASFRLADWDDKAVVAVVFLGVDCPLARLYGPRLAELSREWSPRRVQFVGVNANANDSASDIARYARTHNVSFPILKDVGNVLADRLGAARTPEVFLLDRERIVRYHGRIDDQYTVGVQRAKVEHRDLVVAIEELLAEKPVSRPETEASGCFISRVNDRAGKGRVTYSRDIAPILQKSCQTCHRPGQISPFTLMSYAEAAGWADTIQEVVAANRMPPWHADPRHGRFANDARLSEKDKKLIDEWVRGGCPEGDAAELPPPAVFPKGWTVPTPDAVISLSEPFKVPAQGIVDYQYIEVDPGFREDRWVKAAEIRPGNRGVVHHVNVFLKPPGVHDPKLERPEGYPCLAAAAPGTPPLQLPDGMAKRVPAGWHLVFVMHYTPNGSEQTDQTSLGLVFEQSRQVKKEVITNLVIDTGLCIPPHAKDHRVELTYPVREDLLLLALFPHMHLRGKSFRYEAEYPNGSSEILLDVPRFDFNWENRYVLAEPKLLPRGTVVHCVAVYDNSADNPLNPDPDATVRHGPQVWDEMFNGYLEVALAGQDRTRQATFGETLLTAVGLVGHPVLVLVGMVGFVLFRLRRRLPKAAVSTESIRS
jgi:peroxiredoxin